MLKSIYLGFRKVKVQRVTVVKFGMYDRGGDGVGWMITKTIRSGLCLDGWGKKIRSGGKSQGVCGNLAVSTSVTIFPARLRPQ